MNMEDISSSLTQRSIPMNSNSAKYLELDSNEIARRKWFGLSKVHRNADEKSNVLAATYSQQTAGLSNINMPCNEPSETSIPICTLIQPHMAHFPSVQFPSSQLLEAPVASPMPFSSQVGNFIPMAENSALQMINTVPVAPMYYHEGITQMPGVFFYPSQGFVQVFHQFFYTQNANDF